MEGPRLFDRLPASEQRSSRLFCCRGARRWIPLAYREELYQVLRLTGPLVVFRILNFLLAFVITIFCGHLGKTELAGYALATATINVTTASTGFGLAIPCDTLVSQTFGGKNLTRVGEVLQRCVLILLLFCLPCWAILINTESILLALWQDAEAARIAQLYVTAFLPAVPAMFLHQLQVSYLQNQGIILPQMYTAAVANILNVATNYTLVHWMDLGVEGSAVANSMSQISICLLLFAYIRWKKLHVKTWGGWSSVALQEWGPYMRLAVPSTLMLCFEWWLYEIGGFLAGMLGETDLTAQHVIMTLGFVTYMFPLGVHAAACVRVGNLLGAGETDQAILTSKVSLVLSGVLAMLQGTVLGSTKTVIGFIFTSDVDTVELVSQLLNVYCFLQFFDGLVCVCMGILVGSGKQKIAAVANLIGYYCIGLPLGVSLMFKTQLRLVGLWLGLLICVIMQSSFFITLIFRLNWEKMTEEAQMRARKNRPMALVGRKQPMVEPVTDALVPENSGASHAAGDQFWAQSVSAGGRPNSYTPVSNQGSGALSVPQLLLRRGLVVLAALLVLTAGVAVHLVLPPNMGHQVGNLTRDGGNSSTPTNLTWD